MMYEIAVFEICGMRHRPYPSCWLSSLCQDVQCFKTKEARTLRNGKECSNCDSISVRPSSCVVDISYRNVEWVILVLTRRD